MAASISLKLDDEFRHDSDAGVTTEHLLTHFDRIADAPDAVSRMRRFILDLAAHGRLVPQEPGDGPATELLKRIRRKIDERQKRKLALIEIDSIGKSISLPSNWELVPLGVLGGWATGTGFPKSEQGKDEGAYFFIKVSDMNLPGNERTIVTARNRIDDEAVARMRAKIHSVRTIVFPKIGGAIATNKRRILGRPSAMDNNCLGLTIGNEINLEWAYSLLTNLDFTLHQAGTAVPALQQSRLERIPVGLPPLAEQGRIVAKIDELMALCDRLEAARTERETTRSRMAAASLARLNTPDPAVFRKDAAFTLDNLTPLTTRPDQIKALRQTILNLAVRGKLVPQDPNDEPASELLKRIAARKLYKKRKTDDPRIKLNPAPKCDGFPMTLPRGWAIQSFENLFLFIDYRGKTPPKTDNGVPLITAKNIRMGYLNREPREYISKETFGTWMTRGIPELGDLFFTTEAPLANVCLNLIAEPFALAQRTICLQPYGQVSTKFLMFALMGDLMQTLIDESATGTTARGIKAAKLRPIPIPVPPLAEQRRIVAKVDELMALCDRLEASLTSSFEIRGRLFESALHEALEMTTGV